MKRITILMGVYNCANTLQEALDSLYAQTYQGFKVILCDDGSTDDTLKIAESNASMHNNVIVIKNDKNMGLNFTLNHCLEYADTEYIARMDGDDICVPTRLERELKFLDEHPTYSVVSTPMIYFDDEGEFRIGKGHGEVAKDSFVKGTPICHAPCMARTMAIKNVGGYTVDNRLMRVEDYHLWFKMYAAGHKSYILSEPLYKMRDDRNAYKRRNWNNRKNEMYVKYIGFKMIGVKWYKWIYILRPLFLFLLPSFIYSYLHKNR